MVELSQKQLLMLQNAHYSLAYPDILGNILD